jgi:hypothetical protein
MKERLALKQFQIQPCKTLRIEQPFFRIGGFLSRKGIWIRSAGTLMGESLKTKYKVFLEKAIVE